MTGIEGKRKFNKGVILRVSKSMSLDFSAMRIIPIHMATIPHILMQMVTASSAPFKAEVVMAFMPPEKPENKTEKIIIKLQI